MFHPSFRLSLTVLVHYRLQGIFSLGGWFPPLLPVYMHRDTWEIPKVLYQFRIPDFHCLWCTIPDTSTIGTKSYIGLPQPLARSSSNSKRSLQLPVLRTRFRLFRFRSPLLTESLLFCFPPGTKMFQFPGLPQSRLCSM